MRRYSYENPRPSDGTFERLILDLTKTDISMDRYGTLTFPCRRGLYWMDIDIIEEELPEKTRKQMRAYASEKNFHGDNEIAEVLPVGFLIEKLPPGAVLIRETGGNCHDD